MQQILNFLIKSRNTLWFLFLLVVAVALTIQAHTYHSNKFVNSTGFLTGGVYKLGDDLTSYFGLKKYNKRLLNENTLLKEQLQQLSYSNLKNNSRSTINDSIIDAPVKIPKFQYFSGKVINSSYHKKKNYLTLDKGEKDSVVADMGVITDLGIIGIVREVSQNYATVISILNESSRTNAQLKNTDHFGSLVWNGINPNVVQLIDIPRLAPLKIGDTIITGGRSTIFPKGINIGSIKSYTLNDDQNYFTVNVELFNDMTDVGFVQLIKNNDAKEIRELEKRTNE